MKREKKVNVTATQSKKELVYIGHKLRDEFNFWGEFTTFHGVPIIFRAPNLPLKLFWLALFLIASGLCCFMLSRNFAEYFEYGVTTVIRTKPVKMLRFPLVTVCQCEFLTTRKADQYIKDHFWNEYNVTVESLDDVMKLFPQRNDVGIELSWLKTNAYFEGVKNRTFYEKIELTADEFFYQVKLGDQILELNNDTIESYLDPNYGACFRINYKPGLNPDFDITNVNTGLSMQIYSGEPSVFGFALSKGFKVEVKPHDGYPYLFMSNEISIGEHTSMIVTPKFTKTLPSPFSACVSQDTYKSPLNDIMKSLNMSYRREACLDIYSQVRMAQDVGCYFVGLPPVTGYPPCNRTVFKNVDLFQYQFLDNSQVCPIECESLQYSYEISTDEYPTRNQAQLMKATLEPISNLTYAQIKSRFASVYIRLDSLAIDEKIEQPSIPFMTFIANIGGTVGLFIALSFLSVMEVFEFAIFAVDIFYQVRVRKNIP